MKHLTHIFLILLFFAKSQLALAQGGRDKVEALRVAFITEQVELTNAEAEKFWPVYNEYNDKIRAIRRNLRQSYRSRPENLNDQDAERLYNVFVQSKQAEADAHKQYNEKLKAIIGAKKMVKLRVAEEEFRKKVMEAVKGSKEDGD